MSSLSKYLSLNDNNKINHKIIIMKAAVGVAVGKYISNKENFIFGNSGIGNIVNPIAC